MKVDDIVGDSCEERKEWSEGRMEAGNRNEENAIGLERTTNAFQFQVEQHTLGTVGSAKPICSFYRDGQHRGGGGGGGRAKT